MLREQAKLIVQAHRVLDICLTATAFITAYFIKKHALPAPLRGITTDPNYYIVLLLIIIIWYMVFKFSEIYRPYRKQAFIQIAVNVVKSVSTCLLLFALVLFLFKQHTVSRLFSGFLFV